MQGHKSKRIVFVGSDTKLLKEWAKENETEVVSSLSFLFSMGTRFMPDLIVFLKVKDAELRELRKNEAFKKTVVLIVQENFKDENNFNSISDFPRVLICNEELALEKSFYDSLMEIIEGKKKMLPVKTASIVKYTILFINKNYSKKLTRKNLADQVGVTDDYLSRVFNQEMGIPLWSYLNLLRLNAARELLEQTGISVKQVSSQCGFESSSYFTNCFTKKYGMSPSQVRE
ncbi:helix-turn-helix transcriptional regulator [Treponema sp.]|uniref:helix-turn-helix transcriptional regulator n=1 Tax=Treponema sp. TaxID=166 RepID=UPI0025D216C3|nr:AraC family transcriptional regulator [Treponema sp.]MCR5217815.1 AraC family transcriptional regulator [Treponema sp.]